MSSAFVTVAPKTRAPRSRRRQKKEAQKLKATTTTETEGTQPSTTADASSPPNASSTSPGSTAAPSPQSKSPSSVQSKPSPPVAAKPASIWDKKKAEKAAQKKPVPIQSPPQQSPRKPVPKPAPKPPTPGLGTGSGSTLSSRSRTAFGPRRTAHKYDPSAVSSKRAQEKVDITSKEQFPSLGKKKSGGFQVNRKAVAYNPDEVDMTKKRPDERPVYGAQSSGPMPGGLASRSKGYNRHRNLSGSSEMTFGSGSRRYIPPAVLAKLSATTNAAAESTSIRKEKPAEAERVKPSTSRPSPQRPSPSSQQSTPQRPQPTNPRPATSPQRPRPTTNEQPPTKRVDPKPNSRPQPKVNTNTMSQYESSNNHNQHNLSPPSSNRMAANRDRSENLSPAKSITSTKSSVSSSSSSSLRSERSKTKKKQITPLHLSDGPTKKYLDLRKGGIGSMKDVFLIHNDEKKLHDVASVKKQLANTIAANDESASNEYYYNQQDMVDYAVNSDFAAMNDKSVSASGNKIKSTAEMWNPVGGLGGPAPPGGAVPNPYAAAPLAETVYAQDGLPSTGGIAPGVVNGAVAPSGPGPVPFGGAPQGPPPPQGPGANSVPVPGVGNANSWNPATNFNPMAKGFNPIPSTTYDASPTPQSPRNNNMNIVPDPNARLPLSLQQPPPQQAPAQPMNAMVPTHAPGQVIGGVTEPFPGMIPNVPLVTDPNEIKKNEEIAMTSALSPTVNEFQPTPSTAVHAMAPLGGVQTPLNQQFQFGANQIGGVPPNAAAPYGQVVNPLAHNFLVQNSTANLQTQEWIRNQQQQQQQPTGTGPGGPGPQQAVPPHGAVGNQQVPLHPHMNGAGGGPQGMGPPQDRNSNPSMNGQGVGVGPGPRGQGPPNMNTMNVMNRGNEHQQPNSNPMGFQMHRPPQGHRGGFAANQGPPGGYNQGPPRGGGRGAGNAWNGRRGGGNPRDGGRGRDRGDRGRGHWPQRGGGGRGGNFHSNGMHNGGRDASHWSGDRGPSNYRGGPRRGGYDRRGNSRYNNDNRRRGDSYFRDRPRTRYGQHHGHNQHNQHHRGQSQFQRRQQQQQLKKNQNKLLRENVFDQRDEVKYDATVLPKWAGEGSIDSYFGAVDNPNSELNGENTKLSQLYDKGLYLRFLCDAVSDRVFECLGFKEVVQTVVPAASKSLYARIRESAPVFRKFSLCDWTLDLGGGFVRYIAKPPPEDGSKRDAVICNSILSSKGLFRYKNPKGLRLVEIKYSKSLNQWLGAVPWKELTLYLEQNTKCLESVVLGDGCDPNDRKARRKRPGRGGGGGDGSMHSVSLHAVDRTLVQPLKALFSSLVTAKQFVVESAPFRIDAEWITNLTRIIHDLRLFDERTEWDKYFLIGMKEYFGNLDRLGFPAGCINIPVLVSTVEGSVDELLIRNLGDKHRLSPQDLSMLFERFKAIELDTSLITQYPSPKNKAKIAALSVRADTHNFFIPLLLNVPSSVRTLTIKNATFSSNNLMVDLGQKDKFNTSGVDTLIFEGFADNLEQIWKVLRHDFFPKLRRVEIHVVPTDRSHQHFRSREQQIRQHQQRTPRLQRIDIAAVFRETKY